MDTCEGQSWYHHIKEDNQIYPKMEGLAAVEKDLKLSTSPGEYQASTGDAVNKQQVGAETSK